MVNIWIATYKTPTFASIVVQHVVRLTGGTLVRTAAVDTICDITQGWNKYNLLLINPYQMLETACLKKNLNIKQNPA